MPGGRKKVRKEANGRSPSSRRSQVSRQHGASVLGGSHHLFAGADAPIRRSLRPRWTRLGRLRQPLHPPGRPHLRPLQEVHHGRRQAEPCPRHPRRPVLQAQPRHPPQRNPKLEHSHSQLSTQYGLALPHTRGRRVVRDNFAQGLEYTLGHALWNLTILLNLQAGRPTFTPITPEGLFDARVRSTRSLLSKNSASKPPEQPTKAKQSPTKSPRTSASPNTANQWLVLRCFPL